MILNPQSQQLYRILLSSSHPLSAQELSLRLHTFPTAIYRLCSSLIDLGLITQINSYPNQFVAKPLNEGLSLFLLHQSNWFTHQFKNFPKSFSNNNNQIDFSFVQGRDELMRLSAIDIDHATRTVDLLRSGHEIPATVMLTLVRAKARGVTTRMLIQDFSSQNASQIMSWQKNGILVKKTPLRHLRLMLYDSRIAYFMSYKHTRSSQDMGMKVSYPPFAAILSELFNQWWSTAKNI